MRFSWAASPFSFFVAQAIEFRITGCCTLAAELDAGASPAGGRERIPQQGRNTADVVTHRRVHHPLFGRLLVCRIEELPQGMFPTVFEQQRQGGTVEPRPPEAIGPRGNGVPVWWRQNAPGLWVRRSATASIGTTGSFRQTG